MALMSFNARAAEIITTQSRHTSGAVMMIGGLKEANPPSFRHSEPSSASASSQGEARRFVRQPDASAMFSHPARGSAPVASRVMALSPLVGEAARASQIDGALLMAVIDVESGGNARAVSPKGASGLMQLMPATAMRHGASNLFDPRENIAAGARYLKLLLGQFGDLSLALAAYNAGEGAVQKYGGQIPPYAETMNYVPKVISRYGWYRGVMDGAINASVREARGAGSGRFMIVGGESPGD